jgi:ABC-type glycerol-3-phosphate transport system substrate-binding protein
LRIILGTVFGGLLLWTMAAWWLKPAPPRDGRVPLVWVSDNNPERQRQIQAFNELHPELNLRLDYNNTGLQKIIVQCSSGVGPDLADCGTGVALQTLADAGIAWDVTEAARAGGFDVASNAWPAVREELAYQGRQFSYSCNVTVSILIYNKNVFDKFGVPYPPAEMDWDEFIALAKRVTRVDRSGRDPVYGVTGMGWLFYFQSLRGEYFSADGTRLLLTAEPLRTAFQRHQQMLFEDRVMPTSLEMKTMAGQGGWGAGNLNLFAEGRFAMIAVGKWALIRWRGAHQDQMRRLAQWEAAGGQDPATRPAVLRLGAVRLPHAPGRAPSYGVTSRSAMVNAQSPRRERAVDFLKYLAGPVYSRMINEGVDSLPGNPKYADLGLQEGVPDLAEIELHRAQVAAMQYGYSPRKSPFLLTSDVERVIYTQVSRMEASPDMPVEQLLADAQAELVRLMQRNLDRDPALKARYRELTGSEDVRAAHAGRSL